ncbi:MAG: prolipoprotein diacylglyceryl transferase [Clostridia bacterium]|nr:prolipoprotein diacylglyceryl transferase [Clostridia bacterium]
MTKLIIFLIIGTVLMCGPIVLVAKKHMIGTIKAIAATVILTVCGTSGTLLMYYIENGKFGGLSFFGAVFLVPIVFVLVALILRVPYNKLMDCCAVGECVMLALMKVHCILSGCCIGRPLYVTEKGDVLFPSRSVELVVAIIIFAILFFWAMKGKFTGQLYAWYLVIYGLTRFVLNIFREAWVTKQMLLPFGNIWSLVAIFVGVIWLLVIWKRNKNDKQTAI